MRDHAVGGRRFLRSTSRFDKLKDLSTIEWAQDPESVEGHTDALSPEPIGESADDRGWYNRLIGSFRGR